MSFEEWNKSLGTAATVEPEVTQGFEEWEQSLGSPLTFADVRRDVDLQADFPPTQPPPAGDMNWEDFGLQEIELSEPPIGPNLAGTRRPMTPFGQMQFGAPPAPEQSPEQAVEAEIRDRFSGIIAKQKQDKHRRQEEVRKEELEVKWPGYEEDVQQILKNPYARVINRAVRPLDPFNLSNRLNPLFAENRTQQVSDEAWRRIQQEEIEDEQAGGWSKWKTFGTKGVETTGAMINVAAELALIYMGLGYIGLAGKAAPLALAGEKIAGRILTKPSTAKMATEYLRIGLKAWPEIAATFSAQAGLKTLTSGGDLKEAAKNAAIAFGASIGWAAAAPALTFLKASISGKLGILKARSEVNYNAAVRKQLKSQGRFAEALQNKIEADPAFAEAHRQAIAARDAARRVAPGRELMLRPKAEYAGPAVQKPPAVAAPIERPRDTVTELYAVDVPQKFDMVQVALDKGQLTTRQADQLGRILYDNPAVDIGTLIARYRPAPTVTSEAREIGRALDAGEISPKQAHQRLTRLQETGPTAPQPPVSPAIEARPKVAPAVQPPAEVAAAGQPAPVPSPEGVALQPTSTISARPQDLVELKAAGLSEHELADLTKPDVLRKPDGTEPVTGEPVSLDLYRGEGRTNWAEVYGPGATGPILGKAKYWAMNESDAQTYGPKVNKGRVSLNNPYVLTNNTQLGDLLQAATGNRQIPLENKQRGPIFEKVTKYLKDQGYDGVIVNVAQGADVDSTGASVKRLREIFGRTQVVELKPSARPPAVQPPAEVAAEGQPAPAPSPEIVTEPLKPPPAPITPTEPEIPKEAVGQVEQRPDIFWIRRENFDIEPQKYQYKVGAGKLTFDKWSDLSAEIITVWRDPKDGRLKVTNGHRRVMRGDELDKGLVIHGQGPGGLYKAQLDIDSKTPEEARIAGALQNIGGNKGDALSGSLLLRQTGLTSEDLAAKGLDMTAEVARNSVGLSQLNDNLYQKYLDGEIAQERGVLIGEMVPIAEQNEFYDLIRKRVKKGKPVTNDIIEGVLAQMRAAPSATKIGKVLWGEEEIKTSLVWERADIAKAIERIAGKQMGRFGFVSRHAEFLAKGGNIIDVERSKALADEAEEFSFYFDQLWTAKGPISDAVTRAAEKLKAGGKTSEVAEEATKEISEIIARGEATGVTGGQPVSTSLFAPAETKPTISAAPAPVKAKDTIVPITAHNPKEIPLYQEIGESLNIKYERPWVVNLPKGGKDYLGEVFVGPNDRMILVQPGKSIAETVKGQQDLTDPSFPSGKIIVPEFVQDLGEGFGQAIGNLVNTGRRIFMKGSNYIRRMGKEGKQLHDDFNQIDRRMQININQDKAGTDGILKGLTKKQRQIVAKVADNYKFPEGTVIDPKLQAKGKELLEIRDRARREMAALGGKTHLAEGGSIPTVFVGHGFPQVPNKAGRRWLNLVSAKGKGSAKVLKDLQEMVDEGKIASVDEGVTRIQLYRERQLRAINANLEEERTIDLPDKHREWDPEKVLPNVYRMGWQTVEALRQWQGTTLSGEGEASTKLPQARLLIERISAHEGPEAGKIAEEFINSNFRGSTATRASQQFTGFMQTYEAESKLGGNVPAALRNISDRLPKGLSLAPTRTVLDVMLRLYPPFLNRFLKSSRKLADEALKAGATTQYRMLGEEISGGRLSRLMAKLWGEKGNQETVAIIAKEALIDDVDRLHKLIGRDKPIGKLQEIYETLAGTGPRAVKYRIGDITNQQVLDRLMAGEKLTPDDLGLAEWKAMRSRTFPITLSTQPLWWKNHPYWRLLAKFKPWSIRQQVHMYKDVLKYTVKTGNPTRLMRWMVGTAAAGEFYAFMTDILYDRDRSIISALTDEEKRNAKELAKRGLRDFMLGGNIFMVADFTYGFGEWLAGVVGSTGRNLKDVAVDIWKAPGAEEKAYTIPLTLQRFLEREVPPVRHLESLWNKMDRLFNEDNMMGAYGRWRQNTYDWEYKRRNPSLASQAIKWSEQAIFGPVHYERGEKELPLEMAARQIMVGDNDDAADHLYHLLKRAKTPKERHDFIAGIKQSMQNRSPLGHIAKENRPTFYESLSAKRREEVQNLQLKWLDAYRNALAKAIEKDMARWN